MHIASRKWPTKMYWVFVWNGENLYIRSSLYLIRSTAGRTLSLPAANGAAIPGAQWSQPVPNPSYHPHAVPPATNLYTISHPQLAPPPYAPVQPQLQIPTHAPVITASAPPVVYSQNSRNLMGNISDGVELASGIVDLTSNICDLAGNF